MTSPAGHLLSSKADVDTNISSYSNYEVEDVLDTFGYLEYQQTEYTMRAILVDKVTHFFPPVEETCQEKKVCDALANCLDPVGNFSGRAFFARSKW